jgi:hypothetical protein
MTAALPMGGQKITGMADPTVATDGATKNYVDTTTAAFFSTGDAKLTLKTVADSGWVMFDDGTIGSAGSGASTRANADTQALFNLIFNSIPDAFAAILTSGGGATTRAAQTNAATAWAANCRIALPKTLGRAFAMAGAGAGLLGRVMGASGGSETTTLAQSMLPNVALSYSNSISVSSSTTYFQTNIGPVTITDGSGGQNHIAIPNGAATGATTVTSTGTSSGNTASINGNVAQVAVPIIPPIVYFNAMVKL